MVGLWRERERDAGGKKNVINKTAISMKRKEIKQWKNKKERISWLERKGEHCGIN